MKIDFNFTIPGLEFTRTVCENGSMIFMRWEQPPTEEDERKAEIKESPMLYGGRDTLNYVVSVPLPKEPPRAVCTGCVLLERTSANCYQVAMKNGNRVVITSAKTLQKVTDLCSKFFA